MFEEEEEEWEGVCFINMDLLVPSSQQLFTKGGGAYYNNFERLGHHCKQRRWQEGGEMTMMMTSLVDVMIIANC